MGDLIGVCAVTVISKVYSPQEAVAKGLMICRQDQRMVALQNISNSSSAAACMQHLKDSADN